MYQASIQKLYQDSNLLLLSIRQSEINYYTNYFNTFSNVAALCASLMINTATQVQAYSYSTVCRPLKTWFWMSCVITICVGVHCTVVSCIALVYGVGLALKGPLGSMIRAVKGMDKASKIVLTTYIITMIGFGNICWSLCFFAVIFNSLL